MTCTAQRNSLPVVAIVLAGGSGTRAGSSLPKQFVRVAGKPVLQHTLEVFGRASRVDSIVLVASADWEAETRRALDAATVGKPVVLVEPGATRQASTVRGLQAIKAIEAKVLVHDAARPLVSIRIVDDCIDALDAVDAVDVIVPATDTIVVVDDFGDVVDIPPRDKLRMGQTPQGFLLSTLRAAHAAAGPDLTATDDCGVVRTTCPDVAIGTVLGDRSNVKVTHSEDFVLVDQLLRSSTQVPSVPARATLQDTHHVVVGASRGIGAAIVDALRAEGAVVTALSRSDGVDVRDAADVARALSQAVETHGPLHSAVVSAGVCSASDLTSTSEDLARLVVETNVLGPVFVAQAAHRHLKATGGQLLLIGSSAWTRGRAGQSVYAASKAAVASLTQGLAEEWAADGIRVNCLSPGRTDTALRRAAFADDEPLLSPTEVAGAAVKLLLSGTSGSIVDVKPEPRPSKGAPAPTPTIAPVGLRRAAPVA